MISRVLALALVLVAGCAAPAPAPAPPPTPPAVAAVAPTAPSPTVWLVAPTSPPNLAEPSPTEPPAPKPTAAPSQVSPNAAAVTPSPVPATPTAIALETVTPPDDIGALARAPAATLGTAVGPTAAVLPPSARLQVALTPTPNVLASSPVLGADVRAGGSADYDGAIKLVQDSRKSPGAARLSERVDAAVARARATGSQLEVEGWQAALKGSTEVYQVVFSLRENRQGLRAEWEVNLVTGEVHAVNALAEALDAS